MSFIMASNDTWDLVKAGLSLFANVAEALQKRSASQPYAPSALRAGSDLANIVSILSRRSENAKQSTALAAPASAPIYNGFRLTSLWENPDLGRFGVSYNQQTGFIAFIIANSVNGYNVYYGAAIQEGNSYYALTLGHNSDGDTFVQRSIFSGNALYMSSCNFDTGDLEEFPCSRC
jgi:hypothetical protein